MKTSEYWFDKACEWFLYIAGAYCLVSSVVGHPVRAELQTSIVGLSAVMVAKVLREGWE